MRMEITSLVTKKHVRQRLQGETKHSTLAASASGLKLPDLVASSMPAFFKPSTCSSALFPAHTAFQPPLHVTEALPSLSSRSCFTTSDILQLYNISELVSPGANSTRESSARGVLGEILTFGMSGSVEVSEGVTDNRPSCRAKGSSGESQARTAPPSFCSHW